MVEISALRQENIEKLKEDIYNLVVDKNMLNSDLIVTSTRHKDALDRAKKSLMNAINSIEYLIMCTVQTSKQDRLNVLYNGFLAIKNELLQGKVDGF